MRSSWTHSLLAVGLGLAIASAAWSAEGETYIKEKDVPEKALAALKKAANGAALSEFEHEKKNGKEVYTAKFKDKGGEEKEAAVTPDGTLVGVEDEDEDEKNEKGEKKSK